MTDTICPVPTQQSITISIVAYECLPGKIFVRVPNERARWMLTGRCVAEIACPNCHAVVGEPCFRERHGGRLYHTTPCYRRPKAALIRRSSDAPKPKLRIRVEDIDATNPKPEEETT